MHKTPRYWVVAVHPDGRRERVACGKSNTVRTFAKKIAADHARTYYAQHEVSTTIEKEKVYT